jgi:uracil phosphoribosyltransferase
MGGEVHVIGHPLVQHKLSLLRRKQTSTSEFRSLVAEISMLLAYGKKIVLIPILRAGTGILDGMLRVLPSARVGHIGLYRDPGTLAAVEYYFKVPKVMRDRDAIVVDPMLATGNSAVAAVDRLKATGPRSIKVVCLVTCPEGLRHFHGRHADVPVYTASVDSHLDAHGYIVPGLGDAGDRLFGTK